ncbi:site-specific integrase [Deinococcus sonorensis]|uniref:Site-specific integrase n=2 Tax=Deinococcus sonorensis TaxID=309891 RepID=A0AAU7UBJ3_9DEIO
MPNQPRERGVRGAGTVRVVSAKDERPIRVRWEVWVSLPDGEKKRLSGNVSHPNNPAHAKAAGRRALELAKAKASEQRQNVADRFPDMRMSELLEQWLELRAMELRPKTLESYQSVIRLHVLPYLGTKRVRAVNIDVLTEWQQLLAQTSLQRTRVMAHQRVSQALEWAVSRGIISSNPALNRFTKPKKVQAVRQLDVYTEEERGQLVAAGRSDTGPFGMMTAFALVTGMRRGEVLSLKWSDIKGTVAFIHDSMDAQQRSDGTTKTKAGTRRFPLSSVAMKLLDEQRARQDLLRQRAGPLWTETGYVFTTGEGKPQWADNWSRAHARLCRRIGVRHLTIHDARRTYITHALKNGASEETVASQIGHSNTVLLARTYRVTLAEERARVIEVMVPGF